MAHRLLKSLLFATVLLSFTSFAVGAEAGSGSDSDASDSPRRDSTVYTALVNRETQRVNALCSYCTELASAPISPLGQAEMQIRQSAEPGYASMYAQLVSLPLGLAEAHSFFSRKMLRTHEADLLRSKYIARDRTREIPWHNDPAAGT